MKYKVIISDYDDTFLRKDKTISSAQLKSVKDFIARGGYFIICTGRMIEGIRPLLLKDKIDGYLACFNGAYIENIKKNQVVFCNKISNDICVEIARFSEKYDINLQAYNDTHFITAKENSITDFYKKTIGVKHQAVGSLSNYFLNSKNESYKLMFCDKKEKLDMYFNQIYFLFSNKLEVVRSNDIQIDINSKGVTKGNAVKTISRILNVPLTEIICVGDSGNDIPMLTSGAISMAVDNALDNVKKVCKVIVPSCDDDAIKYIIDNYCI